MTATYDHLPSSSKEAMRIGSKLYFTGKPCKHGHIAHRFTCNETCSECASKIILSGTKRNAHPVEYLRQVLRYDEESGRFFWRVARRNGTVPGDEAGYSTARGTRVIVVDGVHYLGHRLAIFMQTGEWPELTVDHANMIPSDNRISNLRLANQSQQNANKKTWAKSGIKGVFKLGKRWRVAVKGRHIGMFDSPQDAQRAYMKAAREIFGEFARA